MSILERIALFFVIAAVLISFIYLMTKIMPFIEAECRSGSPMSWAYRAEGLCIGSDLEDR